MNMQSDPKYAAQLIISYLKDELSGKAQEDFELWLNASPNNALLVESFRDTGAIQQELNYINSIDTKKGWEALSSQIETTTRPNKFNWSKLAGYSAAAMLLITVGVGLYKFKSNTPPVANTVAAEITKGKYDIMPGGSKATLQMADGSLVDLNGAPVELQGKDGSAIGAKSGVLAYKSNGNKSGYNLLKTPKAGEYKMILPDGTKVWLNAASSLKFPASFNKNERRVELQGEAYFEVAHNKALPFIVSFNNTQVEVLGTHFNISSYGNYSRTTLLEGAVKVTEGEKQRMLKPGQQAFTYEGHLTIRPSDTYKSVAWKEGVFYFKEDRMDDILDQVARWYDVDVVYNEEPGRKRYSGTIRRQATLNQVLEMLTAVSGNTFTLKDRKITVAFNN
jgi:transmembrane sensor